jgi:hypothetical protein
MRKPSARRSIIKRSRANSPCRGSARIGFHEIRIAELQPADSELASVNIRQSNSARRGSAAVGPPEIARHRRAAIRPEGAQ